MSCLETLLTDDSMASTDVILVKNTQTNVEESDISTEAGSSSANKADIKTDPTNQQLKLSRNNSSTYSIPSGAGLVKTSANESINDSLVNPLSLKRITNSNSNSQQLPTSLNNIDYTIITSPNPVQSIRLNTFDTISATSLSNRSMYSFNRIANVNQRNSLSATDNDNSSIYPVQVTKDPVIVRGAGNITIFGVSNKFCETFPSQLYAKLAPEEFRDTIKQINSILSRKLANNFRWLVIGSVFCCCTLGCSLFPVIFMNKKARMSINKFLDTENQRLYLKLGLKWRLAKIKCNSNSLMEYVLLIEFLPTVLLYYPD